jgi:hypothetical protein
MLVDLVGHALEDVPGLFGLKQLLLVDHLPDILLLKALLEKRLVKHGLVEAVDERTDRRELPLCVRTLKSGEDGLHAGKVKLFASL